MKDADVEKEKGSNRFWCYCLYNVIGVIQDTDVGKEKDSNRFDVIVYMILLVWWRMHM